MMKKRGTEKLSISKVIIYVLLIVILIIVVIAGPKKMGTLFEQTGGKIDEFFVWLGLRDDDISEDRCYIEKASKFTNGPEILNYFGASHDDSEMKVCSYWCRLNIRGSKDWDGAYLVERKKEGVVFSKWRSDLPEKDRKYVRLDYKTLGKTELFERELYLAMVDRVSNLEIAYEEGGVEEVHKGWLGNRGIGSWMGKSWAKWYWGKEESKEYDKYCLWEYVNESDSWIHWLCTNAVIKEGGTRYEIYNALRMTFASSNKLSFNEKDYSMNFKRLKDGVKRPMVFVEIGGKRYGIVSEAQETKDFEGNVVSANYSFYELKGEDWKRFDINEKYYLYVSDSYVEEMKGYAKIRDDFLLENCRI
jgi:hypothetical protein